MIDGKHLAWKNKVTDLKHEKIFVTGGAGWLGTEIVERWHRDNQIIVYSRDENKHHYLKKRFPHPNVECIVGDVRDFDTMTRAAKGCTIGVFAASLKQIEACDRNPEEATKTILFGALNSRKVAVDNQMKAAVFISTDKSRAATTVYGALKFVAGESFILNDHRTKTNLSSVIYGNVLNSTGSAIPMIWDAIQNERDLVLYSPHMTRFMIETSSAIDLIEEGLDYTGVNVVPDIESFNVKDLFDIYAEKFGLKYVIGEPRVAEKIHEIMAASEEMTRLHVVGKQETRHGKFIYLIHPKEVTNERMRCQELSSRDCVVSREKLEIILKKKGFYCPDPGRWGLA